jgi:GNAT superfamily N-acetyltransferase
VFRLGRLAVSRMLQGRGLGAELLLAPEVRALSVAIQIGGVALAIDAKDDRAAAWYRRFGAVPLLDDPLKLILPLNLGTRSVPTPIAARLSPGRTFAGHSP